MDEQQANRRAEEHTAMREMVPSAYGRNTFGWKSDERPWSEVVQEIEDSGEEADVFRLFEEGWRHLHPQRVRVGRDESGECCLMVDPIHIFVDALDLKYNHRPVRRSGHR